MDLEKKQNQITDNFQKLQALEMEKTQSEQRVQELLASKGANQSEVEKYMQKQDELKK